MRGARGGRQPARVRRLARGPAAQRRAIASGVQRRGRLPEDDVMARSQGFAIGDFDTSFPLDDKVLDLAGRAGSRPVYYQAVGIYFHIFGAAWRDGERKNVGRLAPGASPRAVALLIEVGLLDADGMLPAKSFENWVGRALEHRKSNADRQRKSRYGRDGGVTAPSVTDSHTQSRTSRAGQDATGKDATGHDVARIPAPAREGEDRK